jgi:hypothetical protein
MLHVSTHGSLSTHCIFISCFCGLFFWMSRSLNCVCVVCCYINIVALETVKGKTMSNISYTCILEP